MLNNFLNNYFGFNKQQRSGLFILITLSFSLLVLRLALPAFITSDPILIADLPLIELPPESVQPQAHEYNAPEKNASTEHALHLFVFDPNTVSHDQLRELGLKEKTAKAFVNFRNKGFVFREKSDLRKVFGITDALYTKLEAYILIAETKKPEKQKREETIATAATVAKEQTPLQIELNSADSVALTGLPGIGPAYAKRILKYRSILGGYISAAQLLEVYGFSAELYEKVKAYVHVDTRSVKKINLNKDDFKVINKHPYLSYEITKNIFEWRKKTTLSAENLSGILADNTLYRKLLPYLAFD